MLHAVCRTLHVVQGALGDCYFLAALANVAEHDELVQDLIVEDYAHLGL
jgi:hypothetical protein